MKPATAEANDAFLRLHLPGGETADFHYFWLRHNCDCCRHPLTKERTLCSSSIPLDLRPATVQADADGVHITWNENGGTHRSDYGYDWLRQHAYAIDREGAAAPASDLGRISFDRRELGRGDLHGKAMAIVAEHGVVVVRGAGTDTEAIIADFARGGFDVIGTHFGRIEDLRTDNTTNANTDQLGYTDAAVQLHSDQPFLPEPPHYQMLHCMRPADRGGENAIVDARQAALYLRDLDAAAFDLLTRVKVRFLRQQKNFTKELLAPIVELRDGEIHRIRSSYFTMAPHKVPFAEMEAWYRAYNRFADLVNDPRHQYRFLLQEGDFLLYDNFRMLHARTQFEGPRWMRGVYFDQARPERRAE